jgi:hypothetical protein
MNYAQEYLAQANRHIAELMVQIVRQRVIVKYTLDTGQRSAMAESLLDALERSLRIFEKHRIFVLSCSGSSSALPPGDAATGWKSPHQPTANKKKAPAAQGRSEAGIRMSRGRP